MGIVAVVEAARLVRGHRRCVRSGEYATSVFVPWKQLFELDSVDNVGIVCNGVKYSSSVGVLEALSSAPTSTVRPFNYGSKTCRQCRRCREVIMHAYSTVMLLLLLVDRIRAVPQPGIVPTGYYVAVWLVLDLVLR